MPINIEDYIAAQTARIAVTAPSFGKEEVMSLEEQAILKLLEMDIPSKVARSTVRKVIGKSTVGQSLSSVVKKAFKLALNMDTGKEQTESVEQADDLRNAVGSNLYENMKRDGSIAETADEF
jgi:hypothetical protein